MTDSDLMPFGKHKGKPMEEVPASYLLWLSDQGDFKQRNAEMSEYIESNRELLEKEVGE